MGPRCTPAACPQLSPVPGPPRSRKVRVGVAPPRMGDPAAHLDPRACGSSAGFGLRLQTGQGRRPLCSGRLETQCALLPRQQGLGGSRVCAWKAFFSSFVFLFLEGVQQRLRLVYSDRTSVTWAAACPRREDLSETVSPRAGVAGTRREALRGRTTRRRAAGGTESLRTARRWTASKNHRNAGNPRFETGVVVFFSFFFFPF